jgi:hypothetical protein
MESQDIIWYKESKIRNGFSLVMIQFKTFREKEITEEIILMD